MMLLIQAERNARRNLFSRDIRSFDDHTVIFKNCAPWGEMNILHNCGFTVVGRVLRSNGDISFVIIRDEENEREFLIESSFFKGWTDAKMMDDYFQFCTSK